MIELYPHQEEVLTRMFNGCVLKGGTGSGKTLTALEYFRRHGEGRRLYVITEAKKRDDGDWYDEMLNLDMWDTVEQAQEEVTVESWQNIKKFVTVKDAFFIFDEQRSCGNGTWSRVFIQICRFNNWIMTSATPGDKWEDYGSLFCAHGWYRSHAHFRRCHVITKWNGHYPVFDHYYGEDVLYSLRAKIVIEMEGWEGKPSSTQVIFCNYNREEYKRVMKEKNYVDEFGDIRPFDNIGAQLNYCRRVLGKHASRLEELNKIVQRHGKVLIFYNYNWEREMLLTWASLSAITIGEWNGHKHEPLANLVSIANVWTYITQYNSGSTAWNCIDTDTILMFSLTYSYKQYIQARGRIDRANSPFDHLYYYEFVTDSYLDRQIRKSLDAKKDFQPISFEHGMARLTREGQDW